jgi:hypothetical protein
MDHPFTTAFAGHRSPEKIRLATDRIHPSGGFSKRVFQPAASDRSRKRFAFSGVARIIGPVGG